MYEGTCISVQYHPPIIKYVTCVHGIFILQILYKSVHQVVSNKHTRVA